MSPATTTPISWFASGRKCLGQSVSGDLAWVNELPGVIVVALFDGLGHGPRAHAAANRAKRVLSSKCELPLLELFDEIDAALKDEIGGVLGVAKFDIDTRSVRYCGVGNVAARRVFPTSTSLPSAPGIVGQRYSRPPVRVVPMSAGDVWLFHTDGVSSNFNIADYPQMAYHAPRTIANTALRRFSSDFDDATCVAIRVNE
ncbi:MAG: SpoIIE family protein phosphatase [Myxococcales bacterium]|nr:SpoIIE family protein phosphatase [Myxococcales bacterium]